MKITYHVAASRDGFIAGKDGDVSWLDSADVGDEHFKLAEFIASVDGLILGRKSYDFLYDYGSWPYGDKPTYVFTRGKITPMTGAILEVVDSIGNFSTAASAHNYQHLWLIGGGQVASDFLDQNLITTLIIAEIPIDLGQGIPIFARHSVEQLDHADKKVIDKGTYRQIIIDF